jgi:putative effector of murein hydrolase
VRDPAARGFSFGVASHGIGTARALQEGDEQGAFAGLGLGRGALATVVVLPLLVLLL